MLTEAVHPVAANLYDKVAARSTEADWDSWDADLRSISSVKITPAGLEGTMHHRRSITNASRN